MTALEVIDAVKGKKGQHVQACWQRQCKTPKRLTDAPMIFKRTKCYVRSGISYANLTDVRSGVESGDREPVQGLPWGHWREGYTNYIIDHDNGVEYVRLYPAVFDNLKPSVEWLMDGKVVPYEAVEPFLTAQDKPKHGEEKSPCFNVKAADIITIAGE